MIENRPPGLSPDLQQNTAIDVGRHEERLQWIIEDHKELKDRVDKLEGRYDAIYEMASSIKTLAVQVETVNTNVNDMKAQFKEDITELKDQQKIIGTKVNKIEIESNAKQESSEKTSKLKFDVISKITTTIVSILLIIVLLALFPHLADIIK